MIVLRQFLWFVLAMTAGHVCVGRVQAQVSEKINTLKVGDAAKDFETLGGVPSYLNRLIDPARRKDAAGIKKLLVTKYDKTRFEYNPAVNDILHASTQRPKLLRSPK